MKTKLSQIAIVRLGHHFREKVSPDPEGTISVVQMKNVNDDLLIEWDNLIKVSSQKFNENAYIQKGEILFANRGNVNYAALVDRDMQNAIAAGNFFIIKVTTDRVLPDYLTWYINQKRAQKYFDQHRAGSYIPTMRGEWLKELEIPVPSLEVQRKVIELDRLHKKEEKLCAAIQKKKRLLIDELVNKKIFERKS